MDKYEYEIRLNEINDLIDEGRYEEAAYVADSINWNKVRKVGTLCRVSDLYKKNGRYEDARDVLLRAYDRQSSNTTILFSLCDLEIKLGEMVRALQFYNEFVRLAPNDYRRYILNYKILRVENLGADGMISSLEKLNAMTHREHWAYELAQLYYQTEQDAKCIAQCDEVIAFFGDGPYVFKALSLKKMLTELTPEQEALLQSYYAYEEEPVVPETEDLPPISETEDLPSFTQTQDLPPVPETEDLPGFTQTQDLPPYQEQPLPEQEEDIIAPEPSGVSNGYTERIIQNALGEEYYPEEATASLPEDVPDATQVIPQHVLAAVTGVLPEEEEESDAEADPDSAEWTDTEGDTKVIDRNERHAAEAADVQYDRLTAQETDGQITMTFGSAPAAERQITGQIDLRQVMSEWAQLRKETEEKHTEEMRRKFKQDTGPLLREFEENTKRGRLEEVEDAVVRQELREQREIPEGTEIGNSAADQPQRESLIREEMATRLWKAGDVRRELRHSSELVNVIPNPQEPEEESTAREAEPAPSAKVREPAPSAEVKKPEPPKKPQMEDLSVTATLNAYEEELRQTTDYEREDEDVKRAEAAIFAAFDEPVHPVPETAKSIPTESEAFEQQSEEPAKASFLEQAGVTAFTEKNDQTVAAHEMAARESFNEEFYHGESTEELYQRIASQEFIAKHAAPLADEEDDLPAEGPAAESDEEEEIDESAELDMTSEIDAIPDELLAEVEDDIAQSEDAEEEYGTSEEDAISEEVGQEYSDSADISHEDEYDEIPDVPRRRQRPVSEGETEDFGYEQLEGQETIRRPAPERTERRVRRSDRDDEERSGEAAKHQDRGRREYDGEHRAERRRGGRNQAARDKALYGLSISIDENRRQIREAVRSIALAAPTGNIILTGAEDKDTLQVAKGLLREVRDRNEGFVGKVAKTTGPILNRKDIVRSLSELEQGALIIDEASALREDRVEILHRELGKEDRGLIVILTDRKRNMDHFLEHNELLLERFTVRVDLAALDGAALVDYAKSYARSQDYSIDAYGALALARRISANQSNDHQVTVEEVKGMVDEAISYASRKSVSHMMDVITKKRYDDEDMIILREKDFSHY